MAVKVVTCVVCSKSEDVKYKCPTCRGPYCSVKCCKEHKLKKCATELQTEIPGSNGEGVFISNVTSTNRMRYNYETEDTVPIEQLEQLRDSRKLKQILENPHLRRMLEAIDRSGDAAHLIGEAMKEPIFTEMADECLRVISGHPNAESDDDCF